MLANEVWRPLRSAVWPSWQTGCPASEILEGDTVGGWRFTSATPARRVSRGCRGSDEPRRLGYTVGMKIAVSVPDDIFQRAEKLAHNAGRSRSEVYSAALREYVARHAPDEVTEAVDRAVAALGHEAPDPFVASATARILSRSEW